MPKIITDIIAWLGGGLVVIMALVGVAYWIFRTFSEKWLTAKFDEQLADYKHEQQKELEELRFKISGLLDRATKLAQREFFPRHGQCSSWHTVACSRLRQECNSIPISTA